MSDLHVGHDHADVDVDPTNHVRDAAVRRAVLLNRVTIGWNVVEAVVALTAAVLAGSVGLFAFGLDSTVEVSASVILAWRLAQERRSGCSQESDRKAQRGIALSFGALAIYVAYEAGSDLLHGQRPEVTAIGIGLAALSLIVMPFLARAKRKLAPVLGSRAQQSEAAQTSLCALMSAVLLVGLAMNALTGWWWADPVAALGIALLAAVEARRTWVAESLADTCCG